MARRARASVVLALAAALTASCGEGVVRGPGGESSVPGRGVTCSDATEAFSPEALGSAPLAPGDELARAVAALRAPDKPHVVPDGEPLRVLRRDEDTALIAIGDTSGDFGTVGVERSGESWRFARSSSQCRLRVVVDGIRASPFELDPAQERSVDDREVRLLVHEEHCASGRSADGRIRKPAIEYTHDAVVITVTVEPVQGGADCQGNPDTPYVVELTEALGDRRVLDGSAHPPTQRG